MPGAKIPSPKKTSRPPQTSTRRKGGGDQRGASPGRPGLSTRALSLPLSPCAAAERRPPVPVPVRPGPPPTPPPRPSRVAEILSAQPPGAARGAGGLSGGLSGRLPGSPVGSGRLCAMLHPARGTVGGDSEPREAFGKPLLRAAGPSGREARSGAAGPPLRSRTDCWCSSGWPPGQTCTRSASPRLPPPTAPRLRPRTLERRAFPVARG